MRELLERDFNKVYPFAKKMGCFNAVFSIIEGTTRGRIWVDHLPNLSIIFVWDTEKRFYLIGDNSKLDQIPDLNRILINTVIEYGIKHKFNQWTFRYKPDEWQPTLLEILAIYLPLKDTRLYFTLVPNGIPPLQDYKDKINQDLHLFPIDRNFFEEKVHLKHFKDILSEINLWYSQETFFDLGYGFCLANDKEIVSWCIGEYFSPKIKQIDIGIETYPPYQQRGLASFTGLSFIQYSIKKGYSLGWHCCKENLASIKTAKKLGFKLKEKYSVLFGWYNRIDALIVQCLV